MPARCLNDGLYASCIFLRTPLRRKSKILTNADSVVLFPSKDHSPKPSRNIKEIASEPMTAVPYPVPEYSHHKPARVSSLSHTTSNASTTTLGSSVTSASSIQATPTVAFKPLPPLLSMPLPQSGFMYTATRSIPSPLVPERTSPMEAAKQSGLRHFKLPIIAITVVASTTLLLALIFAIKFCLRPRRHIRPTPSRPILEDTPSDIDMKMDSSPLFGCDGRQSLPGGNALWTWTQYPQPISNTAPHSGSLRSIEIEGYDGNDEKLEPDNGYMERDSVPPAPQSQGPVMTPANSLQRVSMVLNHVASRLSTASMSLYAKDQTIMDPPFTADGHPALERSISNSSRTVFEPPARKRKDAHDLQSSQGLAYDGANVLSPQVWLPSSKATLAPPPVASAGRSRIKSTYYAANGYPRIPVVPSYVTSASAKSNVPGGKSNTHRSTPKSGSRRVRGTRALTSTLGIDEPELSSPRPTLYPEDSLSVISEMQSQLSNRADEEEDMQDHTRKERARNSQHYESGSLHSRADTTTALGNLMLMDCSSTFKSLTSIPGQDLITAPPIPAAVPPLEMKNQHTKNYLSSEKPPRVPSPPLLPSLAQMALAHNNPEAFANYRSPTYSIYGLYESERKSRAASAFGY